MTQIRLEIPYLATVVAIPSQLRVHRGAVLDPSVNSVQQMHNFSRRLGSSVALLAFQLINMQYLTHLRYSLNPFLEPWTAAENHNGHNWTSVTRVGYVIVGHCKKIRSTYKETGCKSKFPQTLRHGILTDTM
jgi:hypothetical protein